MRRTFFLIFAIMMTSPVALAQTDGCSALLSLNDTGVGVDFTPGVDVRGNPVVPADVDGGNNWWGNQMTFSLEFDLASRYGLAPRGMGMGNARIGVGEITVRGNDVYLNGRLLTTNDRAAVARACREQQR